MLGYFVPIVPPPEDPAIIPCNTTVMSQRLVARGQELTFTVGKPANLNCLVSLEATDPKSLLIIRPINWISGTSSCTENVPHILMRKLRKDTGMAVSAEERICGGDIVRAVDSSSRIEVEYRPRKGSLLSLNITIVGTWMWNVNNLRWVGFPRFSKQNGTLATGQRPDYVPYTWSLHDRLQKQHQLTNRCSHMACAVGSGNLIFICVWLLSEYERKLQYQTRQIFCVVSKVLVIFFVGLLKPASGSLKSFPKEIQIFVTHGTCECTALLLSCDNILETIVGKCTDYVTLIWCPVFCICTWSSWNRYNFLIQYRLAYSMSERSTTSHRFCTFAGDGPSFW